MEYFGVFAFILMLAYSSYPGKVKRLEAKMKRFEKMEKKQKGDPVMSKMIEELVGKQCRIKPDEEIEIMDSWIECQVLDADDEWIKIQYEDKKKGLITKLFRIDNIEEVEIIE